MIEWISVTDRMPEEGEEVIILNAVGDVGKAWIEDGDFTCWDDTVTFSAKVLYWCPIPDLPVLKDDDIEG